MGYTYTETAAEMQSSEAAAVAAIVKEGSQPDAIDLVAPVYYNPATKEFTDLEGFRKQPRRLNGVYDAANVKSFVTLVHHFPSMPRVVAFCREKLTIDCVLNHSTDTEPAFEDAGISLALALDERLKAWKAKSEQWISQRDFMEFLEDRLEDVRSAEGGASQADLLAFVSDLKVTTSAHFASSRNLTNGNFVVECNETNKPSIEAPAMFFLGLPVFEDDAQAYQIPVRMRYRVSEQKLQFFIRLANFKAMLKLAWDGVRQSVIAGLSGDPNPQSGEALLDAVPFYDAEDSVL